MRVFPFCSIETAMKAVAWQKRLLIKRQPNRLVLLLRRFF